MNEIDDIAIPTDEMAGGTLQPGRAPIQSSEVTTAPKIRSRKGIGGTFSHSPNCKCRPCSYRRKQKEAELSGTGIGREASETQLPAITLASGKKVTAPKSLKHRVAQYLHYSALYPDLTKQALAEKMGLHSRQLGRIIRNGNEAGLLDFDDPIERIEYEIIPKVVDNLNWFLDQKDRTITIETAKNTIFKQFTDSKGISEAAQTVLALKIETAPQPAGVEPRQLSGTIVGKPRSLDLTVIDVEPT